MSETALLFLFCFATGLLLALVVRPMYGLYTYVAVFYLDPPSRWWGANLPGIRWSLVTALVTFVAIMIHRRSLNPRHPWYSSTIARVLILYVLWMWLQSPWVISPYHLDGAILLTKYLLLFYMMYTILDNEQDFAGFALAHAMGCAYLGWLIYVAPDRGRLESVGGPGIDNANTLGMHLATGLMFAAFLLLANRGWRRWIVVAAIPFILNGIIQTETRGAIVGVVAGGLATIYLKPKTYRRAYYALAVVALGAVIALANEAFLARMSTLDAAINQQEQWDTSAESRIEIVKAQLRMFSNYPLGAGHQGTAALSRQYLDARWLAINSGTRASHNTVMSVLVDQGVPGIILLSILAVVVLRILRQLKAFDRVGLPDKLGLYRAMIGGTLVTILASGMFAQYLRAEVQCWSLALFAVLWDFSRDAVATKDLRSDLPIFHRSTAGPPAKIGSTLHGRSGSQLSSSE